MILLSAHQLLLTLFDKPQPGKRRALHAPPSNHLSVPSITPHKR
ncbi:hypothetical protein HMPREF1136_1840 [Actinomyces sp. ICM47]|nr:hypothetical protein HMPREF1136_1840 [Actinomyces sp. ICM47]